MKVISFLLLLSLSVFYSESLFSQDKGQDSVSIKQVLQKNSADMETPKISAREQRNQSRMMYLDSLIAMDSTNFKAINQKIGHLIVKNERENAKDLLRALHRRTNHDSRYDFVKATLFEHLKEYRISDSLYHSAYNQKQSELNLAESETGKVEALLDLWYINKYLGEEVKADSISYILRNDYSSNINVGVNWDYFYRRFGDGIFERDIR